MQSLNMFVEVKVTIALAKTAPPCGNLCGSKATLPVVYVRIARWAIVCLKRPPPISRGYPPGTPDSFGTQKPFPARSTQAQGISLYRASDSCQRRCVQMELSSHERSLRPQALP